MVQLGGHLRYDYLLRTRGTKKVHGSDFVGWFYVAKYAIHFADISLGMILQSNKHIDLEFGIHYFVDVQYITIYVVNNPTTYKIIPKIWESIESESKFHFFTIRHLYIYYLTG